MRSLTRSAVLTVAAAGCAAGMAFTAATAGAANTVLMVNGMGAGNLTDIAMSAILNGKWAGTGYVRKNIVWPQQARPVTGKDSMLLGDSINVGATNLDKEMRTALAQLKPGEKVTIVGLSAGALVVDEELRRLAAAPSTAPEKAKLEAYVLADSSRISFNKNRYDAILNYQYRPPVPVKYNTTVVTGEYDGYADYPDRPTNWTAVANAMAGANIVHVPSMLTNLATVPAKNIKTTVNSLGGVTTSYLVPTATLPLVTLNPNLKSQEATLRKTIDAAYFRNDPKVAAAATAVAPQAAASVESVSAPEPAAAPDPDPAPAAKATQVRRGGGGAAAARGKRPAA